MTESIPSTSPISRVSSAGARFKHLEPVDKQRFRYLIADDHPSVTFAVGQLLADVIGVPASQCFTFAGSAELLDACAGPSAEVRVVVLDLVMPGTVKRAKLVQALMRADPDARVLVYTADESAFLAKAVIDAGAMGYVAKTSPAAELMEAIVAVCGGQHHLDGRIDLQSIQSHSWASLTEAEKAVLLALCRGEKAQEIVSRTGRSYSTVTTHKYNGLRKLGLRDGSDLLPYLYTNGLLYELDGDPGCW